MDILNWVYLLKNKLVKTTVQDPAKDLVILGNNVSYVKRGDKYQSYGMTVQDFATYVNESADKCPIQMNFKPGSVGEKVSFTKVSGTDPNIYKDVIIPGELEISRGNSGGGIYNIALEPNYNSSNNSPKNTFWNTQYVTAADTNWAPLWDLENRTYTDWREAVALPSGGYGPPNYVGTPAVMQWDNGVDPVRYWLIMFSHWGVGGENDYSFSYDRYEILPAVSFEQPSTNNTNTPNVIDIISDGVHLTRSYYGGALYNTVSETYSISGASPLNTKWNSSFTDTRAGYSGYTDLSNLESRVYTDFVHALDYNVGNNLPGTELIMHDMTTDLYYKVDFTEWAHGCGGAGNITDYDTLGFGAGYPDGGWYALNGVGGSGTGFGLQVLVNSGVVTNISSWNSGQNYQVGDVLVFPYPGVDVIAPLTIEVTEVCSMGGFAYTRTVIPQSCGVKFADGTVMNTAVTTAGGATGNDLVYTQGLLSPQVESDFIQLSDTITTDAGDILKTYKLGGIVTFDAPGTSSYAYLIGVISGDSNLKLINDSTVISASVNIYDQVSGKFAVNAYVANATTGNIEPLTFATIVLDNTIAGPNDYFISIVAIAGSNWNKTKAYIDIEFASDQALSYYN